MCVCVFVYVCLYECMYACMSMCVYVYYRMYVYDTCMCMRVFLDLHEAF